MKKFRALLIALLAFLMILPSCSSPQIPESEKTSKSETSDKRTESEIPADRSDVTDQVKETVELILTINGHPVPVTWEDNESTAELKKQAIKSEITVNMSPYGGFEQVGSLGKVYPSSDVRQTAEAGDIMLYAASNIVLFYGQNTWAYTKLGKLNLSREELIALLENEPVTFVITTSIG